MSFNESHWVPAFAGTTIFMVIPAEAGIQVANWASAYAGATANFAIPAAFSPCKNGVTAARGAATARE